MRRWIVVLTAGLAVAALAAPVGTAQAAKKYSTTLSALSYGDTLFTGTVSAGGGCKKGREVDVSDTSVPPGPAPPNTAGGSGKSNKKGKFTVDSPFEAQSGHSYVATVGKKTIKVKGKKHKCGAATSPVLTIP